MYIMVIVNLLFILYVSNTIYITNITLHPAHCCNTLISLITHMSESLTTYTGLHAICNRYNCLHFVHQFIHRFLSITLLSFTFVSRRILHIAADPLPLLISNPCALIPLSFSFGLLTVLHHLNVNLVLIIFNFSIK